MELVFSEENLGSARGTLSFGSLGFADGTRQLLGSNPGLLTCNVGLNRVSALEGPLCAAEEADCKQDGLWAWFGLVFL